MAKMTKAQEKRMIKSILQKSKKLFYQPDSVFTTQDMAAMEKLCKKWLKRIG
tara:strand:+ start:315 stop:470 length:156 start_codon:yes stop_codon:yes gene_type:complete